MTVGANLGINMSEAFSIKVVIAHSDPLISAGLAALLKGQRDFEIASCSLNLAELGPIQGDGPSRYVVVADYNSGLQLAASRSAWRDKVMILTNSDSEANIWRALEQGVRGYLLLGCSLKDLVDGVRSVHAGSTVLAPLVAGRIADRMKSEALTTREADILRQIMLGLSNKSIAFKLGLAVGTVKTHIKSILEKLDATSRTDAVVIAQRRGILGEEREWPHPRVKGSRLTGVLRLSGPARNSGQRGKSGRSVDPTAAIPPSAP
jgi:DNA-binding NarL/FixJ family response regulator